MTAPLSADRYNDRITHAAGCAWERGQACDCDREAVQRLLVFGVRTIDWALSKAVDLVVNGTGSITNPVGILNANVNEAATGPENTNAPRSGEASVSATHTGGYTL